MKLFHISDLLSVTTGRLVSSRHVGGVYEILNFLTGDNLYTHQLPRAMDECAPWLRAQFPAIMEDSAGMPERLAVLDATIKAAPENTTAAVANWVEDVRVASGLPEMVPVYELGADMHTHIDPIEEARAMVGDDRVVPARI